MGLRDDLIDLRRDLHRHPEIGLDLPRTQRKVLAAFEGLPLEVTIGTGLSSVTAVLRGGGRPGGERGPAVLLRGDMDALPVTELADVPFASAVPGARESRSAAKADGRLPVGHRDVHHPGWLLSCGPCQGL
ncbi:hypothetical protein [Dactylosporangium sp. NPDC000521]|uniref:hypothetical protein n=1 Tax=Dactylosporangium sp. NPDC000521 TaxID=3363975 RepID=UPI0036818827